jgi:DNA-binding MarR family transcriptional regulator
VIDHPTSGIDETVHQRHRLGILTITAEADRAEFGYLREALDLTPGNLSRHLTVLEDAGLVNVEKGYEGRRPRTWIRITREGRTALSAELDVLAALVRQHAVVARRTRSLRRRAAESAASDVVQQTDGEGSTGDAWTAVVSAAREVVTSADDSGRADDSGSADDSVSVDETPQSDHEPGSDDAAPDANPG